MLVSSDFRSFAWSESKFGSCSLESLTSVSVLARPWHIELVELRLQLDSHGEARVLSLDRWVILLVGPCTWSDQVRKTLKLFAHKDAFFLKSTHGDRVVTWSWNCLHTLVIVHLAHLRSKTVVGRGILGECVGWIVQTSIRRETFCFVQLGRIHPFRGSNTKHWCSFHSFEVKLILAWSWDKLIILLLELVLVLGRHGQLWTIFTSNIFLTISSRPWRELVFLASYFRTKLFSKCKVGCRLLKIGISIVHTGTWLHPWFFVTSKRHALAATEWECRALLVVQVIAVLEIVISWSWNIFLLVLID